jgi:micrococcal nuclease
LDEAVPFKRRRERFEPWRCAWHKIARRRGRLRGAWQALAALVGVAATLWFAGEPYPNASGATGGVVTNGNGAFVMSGQGAFVLCMEASQQNCVIDGDTIRYGGTKIRLEDIDTPETHEPGCASEAALGRRATRRLLELVNAGPFQLARTGGSDEDRYGRKLRTIKRNGRSLGDVLIAEGLARPWDGARRSWCG